MRIYDDLYGLIEFDDKIEKPIINSQFFQRLRKIKQLSLAHYVFPGANHTRFSHSLGVAHLAGILPKGLLNQRDRSILRTAALMHDIGHFPLSHTLEVVYKEQLILIREAAKPPYNAPFSQSGFLDYIIARIDQGDLHETVSAYITESSHYANQITDSLDVAAIITGTHEKTYLNQLLHSDLDIDKMDYLRRDARATGINYGEFALSYLLGNMILHPSNEVPPLLCVDGKALHTVEHYVLAKLFYYLQIIYHKKRLIYDYIAQLLARRLIMMGVIPDLLRLESGISDLSFLRFDDSSFQQAIVEYSNSEAASKAERRLCRVLLDREIVDERLRTQRVGLMRTVDYKAQRDLLTAEVDELVTRRRFREGNLLESNEIQNINRDWAKWILDKYCPSLTPSQINSLVSAQESQFPLVVESAEVYRSKEKTTDDAEKTDCSPIRERNTIKISSEDSIINANSLDCSLIKQLAGMTHYSFRYYYLKEDEYS